MFEMQATDLFVADKAGALFLVELPEEEKASSLRVGTLRQRIRDTKPSYGEGWNFLGDMSNAGDEELVTSYVDFEKKERIVVVRSWKSWYGTFIEEQIWRRFPTLKLRYMCLIQIALSLLFVGILAGFSQAAFTLDNGKVPFTLQTLGVFLCAFLLGVWSTLAVGLYLAFGAAGAHIFASGGFGTKAFESYSSGFLYGFLIAAFMVGLLVSWRGWDRNVYTWFLAICIGWVLIFLPGMALFARKADWNWNQAVAQALRPFLGAEALKFALVTFIIPVTWFGTSRILHTYDRRIAAFTSFKMDLKSFFHPRSISF